MFNFINIEKILTLFNYIFYFLVLNLFFFILNIPIVLFFLFVGISNITTYLPLFLLCAIPFAVSFTTLIYCMNKLIKDGEISLVNDFIKGIKSNFKNTTIIWIVELFLIFILFTNIKFFSLVSKNILLSSLSTCMLVLLLLITPHIFMLTSKFSINIKNTIKSAFILTITRPIITISNIVCLLTTLILFEINPGTTVLFMASISTFLLAFINKDLLKELETKSNS